MKCPKCWQEQLTLVQAKKSHYHYDIRDGEVHVGFEPESMVEEQQEILEEFVYCNGCGTKFKATDNEGVCVNVNGTLIEYREVGK